MGETKASCLWRLLQRGQGEKLAQAEHTGLSASSFLGLTVTLLYGNPQYSHPGLTARLSCREQVTCCDMLCWSLYSHLRRARGTGSRDPKAKVPCP